jgi:hypothetical protein
MNVENGLLIALLLIGIIVFANGLMFLAVRNSARGGKNKPNYLENTKDMFSQPFQKENKKLDELRERVKDLEKK